MIIYAEDKDTGKTDLQISPTDGSPAFYLNFMGSSGDGDLTDNTDFDF